MIVKLTLCITTYKRWSFLEKYLKEYIRNNLIDEIIITDETGDDIEEIMKCSEFQNIKLYKNDNKLGAFKNKEKAVSLSSNDWVCLMDSDNFAPYEYFDVWYKYISENELSAKTIYCPDKTIPQTNHSGFDYTHIDFVNAHNFKNLKNISTMLNTGNYIVNKHVYPNTDIIGSEFEYLSTAPCQEVLFQNALLLQRGCTLQIVKNMRYNHMVHNESLYMSIAHECCKYEGHIMSIYNNFEKYLKPLPIYTLSEWQQLEKKESDLYYNCSEFNFLNDEWVDHSIGLGYLYSRVRNNIISNQIGSHNNLVMCAILTSTDQRRRGHDKINRSNILTNLSKNGIHNKLEDPITYFSSLPTYKFIISPEGNGIDCHRHYESLMAGCIPIIENNDKIKNKYNGCPILYTTDYSEITPRYLEHVYDEMVNKTFNFSNILLSCQSLTIQNEIKKNGNYWCERLNGFKWY